MVVIVVAITLARIQNTKGFPIFTMATTLSETAKAFLNENHQAVLATINKNGTPQLTTMWYFFEDNGTIVMNTQIHLQKTKNMRRDPRVAVNVEDGLRYVSINGTVEIIDDQEVIQQDLKRLVERYVDGEENRQKYLATFFQQQRFALHIKIEKVIENFD